MAKRKKIGRFVALYVILILIALYVLFPIFFMFINSFKTQGEIISSPLALPTNWSFNQIINAVKQLNFGNALIVTLVITIISNILIVITSSLFAWMLVRNKTKASRIILLIIAAAMLIPFQSIMYPLISQFETLKIKNIFGLILMYGGFGLSMAAFLYQGFIQSIPPSLEEAAVIDGCSIFAVYAKVVLPLVKSTTVTVIILNTLWIWNDYLLPFLVLGNSSVKTLTLELYFAKVMSGRYSNPWELIFPAVLVCSIPVIVLFIVLQKHFINGVTDGAIKQ